MNKQSAGFTLVEVSIALVVAAICIFALQRVLPTSLKVAGNATDQTAATTMLASIAQDLRNTPSGASNSPGFGIALPIDTTNASTLISTNLYLAEDGLGVLSPSQARYGATVWLSNAASATVTSLTTARIKVYWPPTGNTQGSVETTTSFNRQFQRGGAYVAVKTGTNSTTLQGGSGGPYTYQKQGSDGQTHYCDKDGYDCDGRDCNGYDRDGRDCDGYDHDGYDRNGCDREGNHKGCGGDHNNGCGQNK